MSRATSVARQFAQTASLTALSALVLLTVAASLVSFYYLRLQTAAHLRSLSTLTAVQAQAAVLFEDRQEADELLRAIAVGGGVAEAELDTADGTSLARHVVENRDAGLTAWLGSEAIIQPIVVDGRRIGSLRLVGSNAALAAAAGGLLLCDLVVAILIAVLAMLLVGRHSRRITWPLTQLRQVMREVIDDGDYSRRAPAFTLAEADGLGQEFNQLLGEIRRRDQEIQQANAALERMALRDTLTGLPNRAMFERAMLQTLRSDAGSARVGLLYLDLDEFKAINDRHGHEAGDRVLTAISRRLQAWLPPGGLAARLGGDEFVVLLSPFPAADAMAAFTTGLRSAVEAELAVGNARLRPRLSIGWAVYPDDVASLDELARTADRSMYADKRRRQAVGA